MTLVSGGGIHVLRAIERFTATRIRREAVPSAEMVAKRRADALVERLRETLAGGPFPHESGIVKQLLTGGRTPEEVAAAILHHFAAPPPDAGRIDELAEPKRRPRDAGGGQRRRPGRPSPPRHDHARAGNKSAHRRSIGPRPRKGGRG